MIDDLRRFLAHAVTLESNAVEAYAQLAADMRRLGQDELAALFHRLGDFSQLHRDETMQRYRSEVGEAIVTIEDLHWPDWHPPEDPRTIDLGTALTPGLALECALELEQSACDYYVAIAAQSRSPEVQELAQQFAEEEAEHVAALERWIARLDRGEPASG